MTPQKQLQKIKGKKLLRQMTAAQRREYARIRDGLTRKQRKNGSSKSNKNTGLWSVSKDHGVTVFKNKNTKLYGITPAEFASIEKIVKSHGGYFLKKAAR